MLDRAHTTSQRRADDAHLSALDRSSTFWLFVVVGTGRAGSGHTKCMRTLALVLGLVGCTGGEFHAADAVLRAGDAGAGGDLPADAGAAGDTVGPTAGTDAGGAPVAGTGGTAAGGSISPAGASSLGGGGQAAGAGGTASGGQPGGGAGASAGGTAAGGFGGGGAAGASGASSAPKQCELPPNGPGSICGGACGYSWAQHPQGYGYPSNDEGCACFAREIDSASWIDVKGDGAVCAPTNANDGPVRAQYTVDWDRCARVWADWPGWKVRVFMPNEKTGTLFDGCALVPGVDAVGNLPSVLVEVFGKGDAWIRVEQVSCDFGATAKACK